MFLISSCEASNQNLARQVLLFIKALRVFVALDYSVCMTNVKCKIRLYLTYMYIYMLHFLGVSVISFL